MTQFDLFNGEKARDEGMARVAENNKDWMVTAISAVASLRDWTGLTEDYKAQVIAAAGEPKHHNAWGSLARLAKARGHIIPTGEYRKMRLVTSHARKTEVYRSRT